MSKIKRWTLRHRVAALAAMLVALAAAAAVAGRSGLTPAPLSTLTPSPAAQQLAAPLPPPAQVFIQRTSAFPNLGNVLVSVQLTSAEIAAKKADGTAEFVTLGSPSALVILRDDGQGGDATAGDGLYTGIASLDDATLQARSQADQSATAAHGNAAVPVFAGRASAGTAPPPIFDWNGFNGGKAVPFDPAVVYLQKEAVTTSSPALRRSHGLVAASAASVVPGTNPFQDGVLMIRDPVVVNDPARTWSSCGGGNPNGVWTFNHLMTSEANQAASGIDPAVYVETWLKNWTAPPTINGHTVSTRNTALILNNWPRRPDTHIDLAQSPFRLLAIVPRVDLRRTTGGGGGYTVSTSGSFLDAGEARFVFGLMTNGCQVQPFAVIFEFRIHQCDCLGVKAWAQQWVNLSTLAIGSAAYNTALENITEQFVKANANPARPNGSALGQQRTNDFALARPWELREFQLTQFPFSMLNETTTADTPIDSFNNGPTFQSWVQTAVEPPLTPPLFQDPIPPVPLFFTGLSFLGSNPAAPAVWSAPGLNLGILKENWARHRASLATCPSCHTTETNTNFTHVDPRTAFGAPAILSGFLTGISVPDPLAPGNLPVRDFDDLARREIDIQQVAAMSCASMATASTASVRAAILATGHLPSDLFATSGGPVPPGRTTSVAIDDMKRNLIFEVH
jgi:hypothetical protein